MKNFSLALLLAAAASIFSAPALAQMPASVALESDGMKAARDLLQALDFRDLMTKNMTTGMPGIVKRTALGRINKNTRLTPQQKSAAISTLEEGLPKAQQALADLPRDAVLMDRIEHDAAALFAKYYTVDDLRSIAQFYRSPAGARMLATMPQVLTESIAVSQKLLEPRIQGVIDDLVPAEAK